MAFILGGAAFAATMLGGTFALYRRDRLHLILGFSAGAVLGVALFDLLPEATDLATRRYSTATVTLFVAVGFFSFIGASDLLPESDHRHPKALTGLMNIAGAAVIWVAIHFAG